MKDYADVGEAIGSLGDYFRFYNQERLHQALGYRTPAAIYFGQESGQNGPTWRRVGRARDRRL